MFDGIIWPAKLRGAVLFMFRVRSNSVASIFEEDRGLPQSAPKYTEQVKKGELIFRRDKRDIYKIIKSQGFLPMAEFMMHKNSTAEEINKFTGGNGKKGLTGKYGVSCATREHIISKLPPNSGHNLYIMEHNGKGYYMSSGMDNGEVNLPYGIDAKNIRGYFDAKEGMAYSVYSEGDNVYLTPNPNVTASEFIRQFQENNLTRNLNTGQDTKVLEIDRKEPPKLFYERERSVNNNATCNIGCTIF